MNWLKRLFGVPEPPPQALPAEGAAEVFDFKENLAAGAAQSVALHVPPPECAIIEIYDNGGNVLCMDRLDVGAAPRGDLHVGHVPSTLVMVPIGPRDHLHQEFYVPLHLLPFPLPDHLRKPDAAHAHVWWSCEVRP